MTGILRDDCEGIPRKKPYVKPELTEHGDFATLTQGDPPLGQGDALHMFGMPFVHPDDDFS